MTHEEKQEALEHNLRSALNKGKSYTARDAHANQVIMLCMIDIAESLSNLNYMICEEIRKDNMRS